jgi:ABC-type sugar transport system ATPase subunit
MEPGPVVRCVNVTKYFGGLRALHRVSLDIYPGEVLGLVGDNGAGKSTLTKVISGVESPDHGELWFGTETTSRLSPQTARAWGVETVYQQLALCDNLSGVDNVLLGQEMVRFRLGPLKFVDPDRSRQRVEELVKEVGVHVDDINAPVRRLSGGQRQALAIARALVLGHRVMIFDEPTAALGAKQTETTLKLIKGLAERGIAIVVISHNLDEVFAVAGRIVVMRLGEIVFDRPAAATNKETVLGSIGGIELARSPGPQ